MKQQGQNSRRRKPQGAHSNPSRPREGSVIGRLQGQGANQAQSDKPTTKEGVTQTEPTPQQEGHKTESVQQETVVLVEVVRTLAPIATHGKGGVGNK